MRAPTPIKTDYLGPTSIVVIDGKHWTVTRPMSCGWELRAEGPNARKDILTFERLKRGEDDKSIQIIRPKGGDPALSTMSLKKRRAMAIKTAWLRRLVQDLRNNVVDSTGDVALEAFQARHEEDVEKEIVAWEQATSFDHSQPKKPRKPTVGTEVVKPTYSLSTRQMRRLLPEFVERNGHPLSMRKKTEKMGKPGPRLSPAVEAIVVQVTKQHASEANQTIANLTRQIGSKMVELNLRENCPCEGTVADRIKDIPEGQRLLARKGAARVRKTFGPFGEGPEYYRVGERVEADCWNIPIMVLLEKAGVLSEVPSDVVTELMIVAQRMHVAVVAESATGYILGMAFGLSESSDLTLAALRMALTDKSGYVAWAGTNCDWSGRTGIEEGVSDGGPAYTNARYEAAVYSACGSVQFVAGGLPHLRGLIESIFSTLHKGFITQFIARAFENVVAKGDYNPAERAVLTAETFLRLLVLYVVDVYHNSLRDGGLRQSPREEYLKLAHGSKEAPNDDELRAWFGVDHEAKLGAHGLQFMHIEYDSDWLVQHRLYRGLEDVHFLVDEQNLGAISVLLDGDYITVPAKDIEFKGVPLQEWLDLLDDLRRRFGEQAKVDFRQFVAPALLDIERTNRKAEAALYATDNVGPAPQGMEVQQEFWSSERFKRLEKNIRIRVVYDRPADPGQPAPSIGAGTVGRSFPRPDRPAASAKTTDSTSQTATPTNVDATASDHDDDPMAKFAPLNIRKN